MVYNQVSSSHGWGVITRLPVKRLGNKLCVSEGTPWTYIYIYGNASNKPLDQKSRVLNVRDKKC